MGIIIVHCTCLDIRASNLFPVKIRLDFYSPTCQKKRNNLKVTLKLSQEAQMGPLKRRSDLLGFGKTAE